MLFQVNWFFTISGQSCWSSTACAWNQTIRIQHVKRHILCVIFTVRQGNLGGGCKG